MANPVDANTPIGCTLQARWEWTTDVASGRWSSKQQAIKQPRYFIPLSANAERGDGFSVRTSKLKIRGKGKAVSLRYESEEGKDFRLLGWAVPFSIETAV